MTDFVLEFNEIDSTQIELVGGKAARLAQLSRIDGISVPAGFCITTDAFRRVMANALSTSSCPDALNQLASLGLTDPEAIRGVSFQIRKALESIAIPGDVDAAIRDTLELFGGQYSYAVRSSATTEDLPTVSFAGQHDSYLNVTGAAAILEHIRRCWASLFTERAVTYRIRNGVNHDAVQMAVVVQRMVVPQCAGVLFTAHPVTGNRKISVIEAAFGVGDTLVAGRLNADSYNVREGMVVSHTTSTVRQTLSNQQAVRLADIGRVIAAHFHHPQDIEWCLDNSAFQIVQTRPITTLFPVPASHDTENHVYISVGHQQMMTDAMKPLGLSMWHLTAIRPMTEAGGRLFVDVTRALALPATRTALQNMLGRSDPLIGDALKTILERGDFVKSLPDGSAADFPAGSIPAPEAIQTDRAIVTALIRQSEASLATMKDDIADKSGSALLDFILSDMQEQKRAVVWPKKPSGYHGGNGSRLVDKRPH